MKKTLRASDVIGRLGGEEFVALLPSTLAEAGIAAERVRRAFEAASILPGAHATATVSIGVACGSPLAEIDTLVARADAALYRAKSNGRNRIEAADEAVAGAPAARPTIEHKNLQRPLPTSVSNLAVPLLGSLRGAVRQDALCNS